jgi:hypothetical protein
MLLPALLLVLVLPAAAQQVYRSTDAAGNVTFSDKPTSGSETVTIETPNVADPVDIPSFTPAPVKQPETKPVVKQTPAAPEGEISAVKKKKHRNKRYTGTYPRINRYPKINKYPR